MKKFLLNSKLFWRVYNLSIKTIIAIMGEEWFERKSFCRWQGYELNLDNPKSLNEKMAWLKLNYFRLDYIDCCDKYLVHDYLKNKLGKDFAPELIFVTQNPKDLTFANIKTFPCIIKTSNGSGTNLIVRNKDQYSEEFIQELFSLYVVQSSFHTTITREHQYDIKKPYIVVEKLLSDEAGDIPNDYKFLYINGELEFIYCSVDRMGANVRQVYDKNWNRLHFIWVEEANRALFDKYDASKSIDQPKSFEEMKRISSILAKDFPMVRIDFYDANEGLFVGEITLHHGSAHDKFYPIEYDYVFGNKLVLPGKNR